MADETIMLAKTYKKPRQFIFPCTVTEKLDGVAADFYGSSLGYTNVRSRQDEPILSVEHIRKWFEGKLPHKHHAVCELYVVGKDFKEISGMSRWKDRQAPELVAYVYDYYVEDQEDMPYKARMELMADNIGMEVEEDSPVQLIPGVYFDNEDKILAYIERFKKERPEAEGLVIRALTGNKSGYKAAWRSPGMVKLKITETIDLEVVGFEEAIDKNDKPKGMVGRINVRYHTGASSDGNNEYTDYITIGAGPGKMSHKMRTEVWNNQKKYIGKIAEIAYMPDDSYEALREPRFYRWRDDKKTPNQE